MKNTWPVSSHVELVVGDQPILVIISIDTARFYPYILAHENLSLWAKGSSVLDHLYWQYLLAICIIRVTDSISL